MGLAPERGLKLKARETKYVIGSKKGDMKLKDEELVKIETE